MRYLSLAVGFWVLAWASPAFAKCPEGLVYKKIGTIADASPAGVTEQIVDGVVSIDAMSWQGTGSAPSFALYDGDVTNGELDADDVKHERGGLASEGAFEAFDAPVDFTDGITVWGNNLAGVTVFRCEPRT